ncbi:type IV secretory system conjugative DNA transfer family protein [Gryllotalpicola reticulitermitis]|uniref:Type IV secretory system conjugative DNA transfer family protein n=1 Tax=Gryllotalpicola reticulitermitis TaxID=1184153 RepID=A0ABV8QBJ8_9MICO
MRAPHGLVFSEVFLPHLLEPERVSEVFTRMAADRAGSVVILETRADKEGIRQLLGCAPEDVHLLRRLLTTTLPGTILTSPGDPARSSVQTAKKLRIQSHGLPLEVSEPERFTRALYGALSRPLKDGEAVVLQVVIGQSSAPQHVPAKIADPHVRFPEAVLTGIPDASSEERNRVRDHLAEHRLDIEIRVGVASPEQSRRQRFGRELMAALRVTESPGVSVRLAPDNPNLMNTGTPPRWWRTRLSVSELVALSGWPIVSDAERSLPGMRPAHPKLLRAERGVETKKGIFARSDVPGDGREIGIARADTVFHFSLIGPTGVGKTTLLERLAKNAIDDGDAICILDAKGQLVDRVLSFIPKERWSDVEVIDATDPNSSTSNPLDARGRNPDVQADFVLNVFRFTFADGWGPRTEDLFSTVLRTLTRAGNARGVPYTLIDIPKVWTNPAFRAEVVGFGAKNDAALQMAWAAFEALGPGQRASMLAAPMNKLNQVLLRPAAVQLFGQAEGSFRLRDIWRERKIVLVQANEALVGPLTAKLIIGLVLAEIWQATQERASEHGHEKRIGHVLLDEADRFMGSLTVSLADAYARSRSLSVSWITAVQYWDQLPHEMKSAIAANARTKIAFKLETDEDARTFAKLAPGLEPADFMALERYQVYVRPVVNGVTTEWALARTLPPVESVHDVADVRAAVLGRHESAPPGSPFQSDDTDQTAAVPSDAAAKAASPDAPVGRRRRRPS